MFFEFPNVTVCVKEWVPCAECVSGNMLVKRSCADVPCSGSEKTFYPMIVLPLLAHIAFVYFMMYKLDTHQKRDPVPYWRIHLTALFTLGVYFIISFGVFFTQDETSDPSVRCTNNFPLMFSIVGILYVIAFSFLFPVVTNCRQPTEDFYTPKYFSVLIAGLTLFLVASRYLIFP